MALRRPAGRLLVPALLGAVLCGGLLFLTRCFSPTLPACSYICNSAEPKCPDEYECRADGYCHLRGSTESCPYSMDLSPAPPRPDLSGPADLASTDAGQDM
jgi:hypothetical protein